jgi:hypothetical protein
MLNDETTDSMADARSIQRMMTNMRKPADAVPVTQTMKSINGNAIAEEEPLTPDNQTQATILPVEKKISDPTENVLTKNTEETADAMVHDDDPKIKNSSDNEESSIANDEIPRDRIDAEGDKTDLLIDNKKVADIVPDGNSDNNDSAFKPSIVAGIIPTSLLLPPIVPGMLPKGQPSVPTVGSAFVQKSPVNVEMTKNLLTNEEKTKNLSTNGNEREKSKSSAKGKSDTKDLPVNGQDNGISVATNGAPLNALVLNKNLGAIESNGRPGSAVSSGSQKPISIRSRSNTEHTIVDLSKVADVSAASQKPDAQISNENVTSSTANFESVTLFTNNKSTEKLSVSDEKSEESTIPSEQTEAPLEFYKKLKVVSTGGANTENLITANGKSEDIQANEFTSLLNKTTLSKFDGESLDVTIANQSMEMINVENETIGALNMTYVKRSTIHTAGRRVRQPSFIDSAHVTQINSSKESHMRALPSEKFWRRNQRRISTAPGAEEGQTAQE